MLISTKDGKIIELTEKEIIKCKLLYEIKTNTVIVEPVPINIDSKYLDFIKKFIKIDNVELKKGYEPLEIYFYNEHLNMIEDLDENFLIELCSAANYLYYSYLLELCCRVIAQKLRYKSLDEVKEYIEPKVDKKETLGWLSSDENNI